MNIYAVPFIDFFLQLETSSAVYDKGHLGQGVTGDHQRFTISKYSR